MGTRLVQETPTAICNEESQRESCLEEPPVQQEMKDSTVQQAGRPGLHRQQSIDDFFSEAHESLTEPSLVRQVCFLCFKSDCPFPFATLPWCWQTLEMCQLSPALAFCSQTSRSMRSVKGVKGSSQAPAIWVHSLEGWSAVS